MRPKRERVSESLVPVLMMLHRLEGASLFRYLAESPAYVPPDAGRWMPVLKGMGLAGNKRLAALEQFLEEAGANASPVHYPSNFASLHYLSMNYLRGRLLADKQGLAAGYGRATASLEGEAESAATRFIREAARVHQADRMAVEGLTGK